jgi:hypothetical protein
MTRMERGWRAVAAAIVLSATLAVPARADLKAALAERDLEKRSKLALDNAEEAYKLVRSAYETGDNTRVSSAAKEIEESVDLAYTSLTATGKDPRKSPKWFKRAEIETRDLLRRLTGFQDQMSFDDRPLMDPAKAKLQQVHDNLLVGLMEGKHK